MHLMPLHAEHLHQEALGQPVAAQYRLGQLDAFRRQRHLALRVHLDQAIARHALERLRHGWRRDTESLGQPRADNGSPSMLML